MPSEGKKVKCVETPAEYIHAGEKLMAKVSGTMLSKAVQGLEQRVAKATAEGATYVSWVSLKDLREVFILVHSLQHLVADLESQLDAKNIADWEKSR